MSAGVVRTGRTDAQDGQKRVLEPGDQVRDEVGQKAGAKPLCSLPIHKLPACRSGAYPLTADGSHSSSASTTSSRFLRAVSASSWLAGAGLLGKEPQGKVTHFVFRQAVGVGNFERARGERRTSTAASKPCERPCRPLTAASEGTPVPL